MMFICRLLPQSYASMVLMVGVVLSTSGVSADQGVDIHDPVSVLELTLIQRKMDNITQTLLTCMQAGKPQAACLCEDVESVKAFNALVQQVDVRHPEWKALDIVRYRAADGTWVSQSLHGLRRQARSQPFCP